MPEEIVIVGGGVIGASAGYSLARAGAKVTLVDREDPGTATLAAAGIISALDDNPPNSDWSEYAFPGMRCYQELAAELEIHRFIESNLFHDAQVRTEECRSFEHQVCKAALSAN